MRLLLGLLALGGLLAGLWLFSDMGAPATGASERPGAVAPRADTGAAGEARVDAARDAQPRAPVVNSQPSPPEPNAKAATRPAGRSRPSGRVAVRGWLRWDDDGSTLAGFEFRLRGPEGVVAITTDGTGFFETAPIVVPGVQLLLHRPSAGGGPWPERLEFAPDRVNVHGSDDQMVELKLLVRRPEAFLDVRVVHRDGRPAPSAGVELALGREERPGEYRYFGREELADDEGVARFALLDLDQVRSIELIARQAAAQVGGDSAPLVSAAIRLELPLDRARLQAPITLVIDTGARLRIAVVTETGIPVPGRQVLAVSPGSDVGVETDAIPITDEEGRLEIDGLPPGELALWILDTPADSALRIELRAGETRAVELVVADGGQQLAVGGRVVDEAGEPLPGVYVHIEYGPRDGPGKTRELVRSGADGTFEVQAEPSDGLWISTMWELSGDKFEPETHKLPFGTRGVLFRRVRAFPRREIAFEITEVGSSERCAGAVVMTYLAPRQDVYAFHLADEGLASPLCSTHAGTTLVVGAPGFRRATLKVAELRRQEPRDGLRRVSLERGLLRRLHVEGDDATGEARPISAARVLDGLHVVGTTDESGDIEIDLGFAPPDGLTIEADGFRSTRWKQADDMAELEPAWIWLERAD